MLQLRSHLEGLVIEVAIGHEPCKRLQPSFKAPVEASLSFLSLDNSVLVGCKPIYDVPFPTHLCLYGPHGLWETGSAQKDLEIQGQVL